MNKKNATVHKTAYDQDHHHRWKLNFCFETFDCRAYLCNSNMNIPFRFGNVIGKISKLC